MGLPWEKTGVMGGYFVAMLPDRHERFQWSLIPFMVIWFLFAIMVILYIFVNVFVPQPRAPLPSEKKFTTLDKDGKVTDPQDLACWMDRTREKWIAARKEGKTIDVYTEVEAPEVFMTVVVPAFNEEKRLTGMLEETVNFLENEYSNTVLEDTSKEAANGNVRKRKGATSPNPVTTPRGWEILLVNDGSKDRTIEIAEKFTRTHQLPHHTRRASGPWSHGTSGNAVNIPVGSIRMITLQQNRGKGGAVIHGMRHARGQYIIFADADGASKIDDLTKLVKACQEVEDPDGRGVAVGSRAHLVGSEAVVKRSKLRNFLMHSFHLLLWCMTPPQTASIKDTQCGFKLFSRPCLPYIVPHMHMEGWIFDVEMLMLAEFANIPVVEVPIGWREVVGSKLNVLKDSFGMAWDLALLRFCWGTGIYRR